MKYEHLMMGVLSLTIIILLIIFVALPKHNDYIAKENSLNIAKAQQQTLSVLFPFNETTNQWISMNDICVELIKQSQGGNSNE